MSKPSRPVAAAVVAASRRLLAWHAAFGVEPLAARLPAPPKARRLPWAASTPAPAPSAMTATPSSSSPPGARARLVGQTIMRHADAVAEAYDVAQQAASLAQWTDAIHHFHLCGLRAMAQNTVVTDGVPDGRLLILGEAPGADEDRQGLPFVGRSGRLLDQMLKAIDVSRQHNALISNVVYWRPPMNRKPDDDELELCAPFVHRLIALLQPHCVLLLGATAVRSVLPGAGAGSLKSLRGQVYRYAPPHSLRAPARPGDPPAAPLTQMDIADPAQCAVIVSYHPSYLLRQPRAKSLAWSDLLLLRQRLTAVGFPFFAPGDSPQRPEPHAHPSV